MEIEHKPTEKRKYAKSSEWNREKRRKKNNTNRRKRRMERYSFQKKQILSLLALEKAHATKTNKQTYIQKSKRKPNPKMTQTQAHNPNQNSNKKETNQTQSKSVLANPPNAPPRRTGISNESTTLERSQTLQQASTDQPKRRNIDADGKIAIR